MRKLGGEGSNSHRVCLQPLCTGVFTFFSLGAALGEKKALALSVGDVLYEYAARDRCTRRKRGPMKISATEQTISPLHVAWGGCLG